MENDEIANLKVALENILHYFDRDLAEGTIGRKVCDAARKLTEKD